MLMMVMVLVLVVITAGQENKNAQPKNTHQMCRETRQTSQTHR